MLLYCKHCATLHRYIVERHPEKWPRGRDIDCICCQPGKTPHEPFNRAASLPIHPCSLLTTTTGLCSLANIEYHLWSALIKAQRSESIYGTKSYFTNDAISRDAFSVHRVGQLFICKKWKILYLLIWWLVWLFVNRRFKYNSTSSPPILTSTSDVIKSCSRRATRKSVS